jgi:hypothetical protein
MLRTIACSHQNEKICARDPFSVPRLACSAEQGKHLSGFMAVWPFFLVFSLQQQRTPPSHRARNRSNVVESATSLSIWLLQSCLCYGSWEGALYTMLCLLDLYAMALMLSRTSPTEPRPLFPQLYSEYPRGLPVQLTFG